VREALSHGKLRQQQIIPACYDPGLLRRALEPDDDYFERAWPRTKRHLELLREAVASDHAQFILLIIPDGSQLDRLSHEFAKSIGYDVDPAWLTGSCRTREALLAWSRGAGVPVLDLTEEFRQSMSPLYYRQDGHFNSAGHERTAEVLAEFLKTLK
jgi:SGNH hydrolase-like domain, acetyltransferase AlgX